MIHKPKVLKRKSGSTSQKQRKTSEEQQRTSSKKTEKQRKAICTSDEDSSYFAAACAGLGDEEDEGEDRDEGEDNEEGVYITSTVAPAISKVNSLPLAKVHVARKSKSNINASQERSSTASQKLRMPKNRTRVSLYQRLKEFPHDTLSIDNGELFCDCCSKG